jgi:phage terminase large subunit
MHPMAREKGTVYGIDFGFNNQSAIVELYLYENALYLKELLYQSHLTNADLITKLKELKIPQDAPIYADAAEPQRIEEIYSAGWNIKPADKSVKDGIDFLKRYRLHIDPNSANILNEIRAYSYRKDKNGQVLEEPVKFRDHLMDAARYGAYTHWHKPEGEPIPEELASFGGIREDRL